MWKQMASIIIHWCLLNVYGGQTVDESTVRQWVGHFSCGDSDVKDKLCSRQPCTAVTPWNEEHVDQLICANQRITTRELCMELHMSFNLLEMIVATLECCKVCSKWVPQMLIQEQKEHHMQAFQNLLNSMWVPHLRKCSRQSPGKAKRCALSFGIGKG